MKNPPSPQPPLHRRMWSDLFETDDGGERFQEAPAAERDFVLGSLLYLVNDNLCRLLASGRAGQRRVAGHLERLVELWEDDDAPGSEGDDAQADDAQGEDDPLPTRAAS